MNHIRNSAKAIILKDNKLLAVKMRDEEGFWYMLPGGGQEFGENLHETLKRECMEEIGVDVEIGALVFVRDYLGKNHEFADTSWDEHNVEFMFLCRIAHDAEVGNGTAPDTGMLGVEWLDLEKLDNYRLYPLALRPLIESCEGKSAPVYLGDVN